MLGYRDISNKCRKDPWVIGSVNKSLSLFVRCKNKIEIEIILLADSYLKQLTCQISLSANNDCVLLLITRWQPGQQIDEEEAMIRTIW